MARLPFVTRDQLSETDRGLFDQLEQQRGSVSNVFRMTAHNPELLRRLLHFGDGLRHHTRLDARLRELAILLVASLTGCPYVFEHHQPLALKAGASPEQLAHLLDWETHPSFDAETRAILRFAAETTQQVSVQQETFERLSTFLDAEQVVALTMNVGFYNMVVRFLMPLEVELEPEYRQDT